MGPSVTRSPWRSAWKASRSSGNLCVAPCRFERIDYMAVVAFRELPR